MDFVVEDKRTHTGTEENRFIRRQYFVFFLTFVGFDGSTVQQVSDENRSFGLAVTSKWIF